MIKEVTAISSANGNIDFSLNGYDYIVVGVQSYNSNGVNNDCVIIPYKVGDGKPSGTISGRWGGHCISSYAGNAVIANTTIYCTVIYMKQSH